RLHTYMMLCLHTCAAILYTAPLLLDYVCLLFGLTFFFFFMIPPPPSSTLFPYTTLFRSWPRSSVASASIRAIRSVIVSDRIARIDRKSTRLNSSHQIISYAVFCLKKKKNGKRTDRSRTTIKQSSIFIDDTNGAH